MKIQEMREYRGIGLLILASLVVAIAIIADGQLARTINGVGGLLWIASVVFLIRELRTETRFASLLALSASATLVLVLLTKPSDYLSATIGFAVAGAIMGYLATSRGIVWPAIIPALWLPMHLLVAMIKVLDRTIRDRPASIRTEPPPTSALVPFAMVLAAILGGIAIQSWRAREATIRTLRQQRPSKV